MTRFLILIFLTTMYHHEVVESRVNLDPLLISTTSGYLRGTKGNTVYGDVRKFLNVPYAPEPIRFQIPVEIDTPNAMRDATKLGPACPQPGHLKETLSPLLDINETMAYNEDCLALNVYIPDGVVSDKRPVMVWIPGEGFNYAIPQQFDVSYLAVLGDVIVVTISYRVGVFGFLSTGTRDAPGNLGFWDQQMALKWIKSNIEAFGGDKKKVTLFGRFSGSMSITAQMVSPLNRDSGLFNRTILQSGIATGKWVFDSQPEVLANSLAQEVGCRQDIVKCMRELPYKTLLEKSMYMPWRPTLDGTFLTEDPMESLEKGNVANVDVTIGLNSDEGSLCLLSLYYLNSTYYNKVINDQLTRLDFDNLLRQDIRDFTKVNPHEDIHGLTSHEYGNRGNSFRESYIEFCGAMYITSQMEMAARYLSNRNAGNKVYMYQFDHRPSFSIHPQFLRAAHGDDILFSLGLVQKNNKLPREELELSRKMIEAFASFANNGSFSFNQGDGSRETLPEYDQENGQIVHFSTSPAVIESRKTYDRAANFWHSVIPTISGIVSRSHQNMLELQITNRTAGYIVGTLLSVQNTEYVLLTLVCLTLLLVVLLSIYPIFLRKRTIKDGMLMDY